MNKAIVICYDGLPISTKAAREIQQTITDHCNAMPERITIKAFDEDSITKALLKKSAEDLKISFKEDTDEKQPTGTIRITFNPEACEEKVRIIKCIKNSLGCDLKKAKDMFDCGTVYIPRIWSDHKMYDFIRDLSAYKVTITRGMEDIAIIQAAIFLNQTYGTKDSIALVRDFAAAVYHSHTNSTDEKEQALLAAVELVKTQQASATRWVSSELINVINSL